MPPLIVADVPEPEFVIGFVVMSIAYFTIAGVISTAIGNAERRLILLGLLTVIASVGYANFFAGPGMIVTPTITKLGVLLVLAGIVSRLLEPRGVRGADPAVQKWTSAYRQAAQAVADEPTMPSSLPEN